MGSCPFCHGTGLVSFFLFKTRERKKERERKRKRKKEKKLEEEEERRREIMKRKERGREELTFVFFSVGKTSQYFEEILDSISGIFGTLFIIYYLKILLFLNKNGRYKTNK